MSIDRTNPEKVRESPHLVPNSKLIKDLRKARRLTQLQLANFADVSERTVRRAETGKPVRIQSLELLATALGAEFFDLVDNDEQYRKIRSEQRKLDRVLLGLRTAVVDHDFSCFAETLDKNIHVKIYGPADIPFVGDFKGHAAVRGMMFDIAPELFTYIVPPLFERVTASGNLVVLTGYDKVRMHHSNLICHSWWQHVYEFENGKVTYCNEVFDTRAFVGKVNPNDL